MIIKRCRHCWFSWTRRTADTSFNYRLMAPPSCSWEPRLTGSHGRMPNWWSADGNTALATTADRRSLVILSTPASRRWPWDAVGEIQHPICRVAINGRNNPRTTKLSRAKMRRSERAEVTTASRASSVQCYLAYTYSFVALISFRTHKMGSFYISGQKSVITFAVINWPPFL